MLASFAIARPSLEQLADPLLAETTQELDQIRLLSHETFAEEIPQHPPQPDGIHIDKFEEDVLAAWVAEMDFPLAEPIHRVLAEAVERQT